MGPLFDKRAWQEGDPDSGRDELKDELGLNTASSDLWRDSFVAAGVKDDDVDLALRALHRRQEIVHVD